MSLEFTIRQATVADIDHLVPLFDAYRQFYRKASDLAGARQFLLGRFDHGQSVIFLALNNALDGGEAIGFTQLYPCFSSAAMARTFILNDLFVAPHARHHGTGAALLRAAADYGRAVGAVRLSLSTELANSTAQALYERTGWTRDQVFCGYHLAL